MQRFLSNLSVILCALAWILPARAQEQGPLTVLRGWDWSESQQTLPTVADGEGGYVTDWFDIYQWDRIYLTDGTGYWGRRDNSGWELSSALTQDNPYAAPGKVTASSPNSNADNGINWSGGQTTVRLHFAVDALGAPVNLWVEPKPAEWQLFSKNGNVPLEFTAQEDGTYLSEPVTWERYDGFYLMLGDKYWLRDGNNWSITWANNSPENAYSHLTEQTEMVEGTSKLHVCWDEDTATVRLHFSITDGVPSRFWVEAVADDPVEPGVLTLLRAWDYSNQSETLQLTQNEEGEYLSDWFDIYQWDHIYVTDGVTRWGQYDAAKWDLSPANNKDNPYAALAPRPEGNNGICWNAADGRIRIHFSTDQGGTPVNLWVEPTPEEPLQWVLLHSALGSLPAKNLGSNQFVFEDVMLNHWDRLTLSNGQTEFFRASHKDSNTDGWYINLGTAAANPYKAFSDHAITTGHDDSAINWHDVTAVADIHFTQEGGKPVNLYVDPKPVWMVMVSPAGSADTWIPYPCTAKGDGTYEATGFTLSKGALLYLACIDHTYWRAGNDDSSLTDGWQLTGYNTPEHPYTTLSAIMINDAGHPEWNALVWNDDVPFGGTLRFSHDGDWGHAPASLCVINDKGELAEWDGTFAPGYPRAYLMSAVLNDNKAVPGYELAPTGQGEFSLLSFALRNTLCKTADNSLTPGTAVMKVRVYVSADSYITLQWDDAEHNRFYEWPIFHSADPGVLADARFTLSTDTPMLKSSTLELTPHAAGTEWLDNSLPYLGILGMNFVQENEFPTRHVKDGVQENTSNGWQEAYIEYDAAGNPRIDRDGFAIYNTVWPPRHNILMQTRLEGFEPLGISSSTLTFTPDMDTDGRPVVRTAAQWRALLQAEDPDAYAALGDPLPDGQPGLSDRRYVRMACHNMWMQGEFKIWSGWGGQMADWGAQWNNHFYLSAAPTDDKLPQSITREQQNYRLTASMQNNNPNLLIEHPTFYTTVEVFVPVDENGQLPHTGTDGWELGINDARLYLTRPLLGARINAVKADPSRPRAAYYLPSLELDEGWYVTEYRIVRCDYNVNPGSRNQADFQPVDRQYIPCSLQEATVTSNHSLHLYADDWEALWAHGTPYRGVNWTLDGDLDDGTYFYYMEVTAASDDGDEITAMVTSPWLSVTAVPTSTPAIPYQLLKTGEHTYLATSYFDGYNEAQPPVYDVVLDESETRVLSMTRHTDYIYWVQCPALWTGRVLVHAPMPEFYQRLGDAVRRADRFDILGRTTVLYDSEGNLLDSPLTEELPAVSLLGGFSDDVHDYYALYDLTPLADRKVTGEWAVDFAASHGPSAGDLEQLSTVPRYRALEPAFPGSVMTDVALSAFPLPDPEDVTALSALTGQSHTVANVPVHEYGFQGMIQPPLMVPELAAKVMPLLRTFTLRLPDGRCWDVTFDHTVPMTSHALTVSGIDPGLYGDNEEVTLEYFCTGGEHTYARFLKPAFISGTGWIFSKNFCSAGWPELQGTRIRRRIKAVPEHGPNMYAEVLELLELKNNCHDIEDYRTKFILYNDRTVSLMTPHDSRLCYTMSVGDTPVLREGSPFHVWEEVTDPSTPVTLVQSEPFHWYAEMYTDDHLGTLPDLNVWISNFIRIEGDGHSSCPQMHVSPAPAEATRAPLRAAAEATHTVLESNRATLALSADNIITSVERTDAPHTHVSASQGCITVHTPGVTLCTMDGKVLPAGVGTHPVPRGLYLASTPAGTVRLMVP